MTNWTGKIAGFIIGYMFGGPITAVVGMFIGHLFDLGGPTAALGGMGGVSAQQRYLIQQAYFKATFLIMGHIAKADGRVSEDEIRTAKNIMKNMNLNQRQRLEAINLFTQGKQPNFNLEQALQELFQVCGQNQQMLYRMFIDIQFRAAAADGSISLNKQRILRRICDFFGIKFEEFASFYQYQRAYDYHETPHYHGRQRAQQNRQQYQRQYRQTGGARTGPSRLESAYSVLGVNSSDDDAYVKKAYRKKMSENHPDKLISKGLPEEMIKLANQKTSEIKKAYDTIMKARGRK